MEELCIVTNHTLAHIDYTKNYHILEEDINAKMVNGYTLEENKILKNICMKLQTNNLQQLDLNNISILNKISPEEYNFLTKIISQ